MGRKNKLKRFADITSFPNVIEVDPAMEDIPWTIEREPHHLKGEWSQSHFNNDHPLVLELACAKGEYTIALARDNPDKNFIGIDIKGARIWIGAKKALESSLNNVAFLRTRIEFIERFFNPGEVSEIWITFPDPFEGKESRRLTSPSFINRYRNVLKPDGLVHLKSDSILLYEYTLDVIANDPQCQLIYSHPDIYSVPIAFPELEHKTFYERKHLSEGKQITYIQFKL